MIESKEQLLSNFKSKADDFLASPGPVAGIEFDDAVVTLKRYVLTEMKDEELGALLGGFQKRIRMLELEALTELVVQVIGKLED